MKQLKVFAIPAEIDALNRFLATNPPELITPFEDKITVVYDDATYPTAYKIEEIRALMSGNIKEMMTHAISMSVSELDLEFAKGLLAEAEKIEVPIDPKTKKPDAAKTAEKETKIKEHTNSIAGLSNGISNLAEMIRRFNTRNIAMQKMLDSIISNDGTINTNEPQGGTSSPTQVAA